MFLKYSQSFLYFCLSKSIYVSDFKYFSRLTSEKYNSKRQMVGAHIKYVKEKAEEMIGDYKRILDNVDLVNKRINSRVAMSFVMAIPNALSKEEIKEWLKKIRELIGELLKIKEEDIFVAYHNGKDSISSRENKHFHIVLTPRTREGKPLRLKRTDLKEFHGRLQEYIEQKGFKIRKDKEDERIGHIGTRLRYDEELRKLYIETLESKEKLREIEENLIKEHYRRIKNLIKEKEKIRNRKKEIKEVRLKNLEVKGLERISYKELEIYKKEIGVEKDGRYKGIRESIQGVIEGIRGIKRREYKTERREPEIKGDKQTFKRTNKFTPEGIGEIPRSVSRELPEYEEFIRRYRESIERIEELRKEEEEKKKLKEELYRILRDMEREEEAIGKECKEEKGYKIYKTRNKEDSMIALLLTDKFIEKDKELLEEGYEIIGFKDFNLLPEILNSLDREYVFYQLRLDGKYKFSELDKGKFIKQLYNQLRIDEKKKRKRRKPKF